MHLSLLFPYLWLETRKEDRIPVWLWCCLPPGPAGWGPDTGGSYCSVFSHLFIFAHFKILHLFGCVYDRLLLFSHIPSSWIYGLCCTYFITLNSKFIKTNKQTQTLLCDMEGLLCCLPFILSTSAADTPDSWLCYLTFSSQISVNSLWYSQRFFSFWNHVLGIFWHPYWKVG